MSHNYISSSEFADLCQSQITLLTKSLGAVWSVVYLSEEASTGGDARVHPFAIYPQANSDRLNLPAIRMSQMWQQLADFPFQLLPGELTESAKSIGAIKADLTSAVARKQIILPLVHQEAFIGLLVAGREDREWQTAELQQVEQIGKTIAIARFLELQYHWTQEELDQQTNLRRLEQDRLENLLHQLRNPLTALRTFGKLLVKRLAPEDTNAKVAQSILEQSDRFQQLLEQFEAESSKDQLLDDQEVDHSDSPLLNASENTATGSNFLLPSSAAELSQIDLQTIFLPLLNTAKAIAREREIELIIDLPATMPQVKGDAAALREIFNNLLDNALKYTPHGGKIQLNLATKPKMLGILIADTGYGIPLEVQGRIFERHYRGVQEQSDIPGTGLGLAIAQELATKMQGEIELISPNSLSANSPGTTFIVWLAIDTV